MLTIASAAHWLTGAPMLGWTLGWQEILVIVVVVLILFGGKKIPELARGIGKGMREFKRELGGIKKDFEEAADDATRDDADDYDRPRPKKRRPAPPENAPESRGDQEASAEEEANTKVKQG